MVYATKKTQAKEGAEMSELQGSCYLQDSQRVKKFLCRGMYCKKCNEFRINYDQAVINYHLQDMAKKEPVGIDKTAPETYLKLKAEIERLKAENEKLKSANAELTKFVAIEIGGHKSTMELVSELQSELARVRGIAERVCEFYGNKEKVVNTGVRWSMDHQYTCDYEFDDVTDGKKFYASGKLARQAMNELKEGGE